MDKENGKNRFGLIGEKLGHSFSPLLHERFGDYDYSLMEVSREDIDAFFESADFDGANVTIPYKEKAMAYCIPDENAKKIGCVNTLVKGEGGLRGYNTDTFGFEYMAKRAGITFSGRSVTILGSGGTCRTAAYTASRLGASQITVVSRHPSDMGLVLDCPVRYVSYGEKHDDCNILINTTPVGMYPDITGIPEEIDDNNCYVNLEAVLDVIYNPLRTRLVMSAKNRGIIATGGLSMLVAQGYFASVLFKGSNLSDDPVGDLGPGDKERLEKVIEEITDSVSNIVLTGMPGSGKSTVAKLLAGCLKLEFVDTDEIFLEENGINPGSFIRKYGEKEFRRLEKQAVIKASSKGGRIIATGGGVVMDPENTGYLRLNGNIVYINRRLKELAVKGRPLSEGSENLKALYFKRLPVYLANCDMMVNVKGTPQDVCSDILNSLHNKERKMKFLILNGPNINMLGIREPDIYGHETYDDLLKLCRSKAEEIGVEVDFYQSNHEGDLVDIIQQAYGTTDGIIINPGAYTHTSVALLDALKCTGIPTIEVHISDVGSREDFRQVSYIRSYVKDTITGRGLAGYTVAMEKLFGILGTDSGGEKR